MGQAMPVTAQPIPVTPPEEKTDVSFIVSIILGVLLLVAIAIIVVMMVTKNRRSGDPTYDLVRSKYPNLPVSMTRGMAPLPRLNPFGVRR